MGGSTSSQRISFAQLVLDMGLAKKPDLARAKKAIKAAKADGKKLRHKQLWEWEIDEDVPTKYVGFHRFKSPWWDGPGVGNRDSTTWTSTSSCVLATSTQASGKRRWCKPWRLAEA